MNITDFVESIKLQLSDLERVGEIGYVEGISNIIVKNLNQVRVLYVEYKEERARLMRGEEKKKKVVSKGTAVKKVTKKPNLVVVDDA